MRTVVIATSVKDVSTDGASVAKAGAEVARQEADARRDAAVEQARAAAEARSKELDDALIAHAAELAPGALSAGPDQPWVAPPSIAARQVRRGTVDGIPVVTPLIDDRGWALAGETAQTAEQIRTTLLRLVASLPLKHLRIDVHDPRFEGRLGVLAPLRSAHASAFPPPATSATAFRDVLESVSASAAANAETIAVEGCRSLGQLWDSRGIAAGEYRVVTVLNYPEGIDRETQASLVRLARTGGPNGVVLLVQHDETARPADDQVRADELLTLLRKSRSEPGRLLLDGFPMDAEITPDPPLDAALVARVIDEAVGRSAQTTGPVVELDDLIGVHSSDPWSGDSTDGLDAVIGRIGQRDLTLSIRSSNPPLSNLLIGGAVGQGKSNLLLDLVYALAARYSPDDLELHLLDFKSGLEFQTFAPDADGRNWLPHARVLSLDSDRAFGVAVLRHVADELKRRAALFKARGVSGIEDYRRLGDTVMPRLVLIVDEFQVIFEGDDRLTDEAVELLETLSRQGRASGVHLVLASQTISGVSGLRVKGESIFAQFPLRVSLKNTANESEAILSQGNKAASELTYRGEVIVNRNFGLDPAGSNERAIVAYADPEFTDPLQDRLWALRPDATPPLVFVASDFARRPADLALSARTGLLGRPVAVTDRTVEITLEDDVDQSIAVVGADAELALAAIDGLLGSFAPGSWDSVVVIDLTVSTAADAGHDLHLPDTALRFGRAEALEGLLRTVRPALVDGGSMLVVGLGWQRWSGLDDVHPANPDDEDDYATVSPREVIADLAQQGSACGVHLIAWWSTLRAANDQLGYGLDGVRHLVTAKLPLEEWKSVTGPSEPGIVGHPRVGHVDRSSDAGPMAVIPFERGER